MADLEFYHDEEGNACVRGEDERLATFIQTDLQGATSVITDLITLLKNEEHADFNGNAHSLNISTKTVTIEANFDDEAPDRRLPRDEMLEHIQAWYDFVSNNDAALT